MTQLYINFSRQKHQIDAWYVSFKTWDSQVSSYTPFYFSFTVPLNKSNWQNHDLFVCESLYLYIISSWDAVDEDGISKINLKDWKGKKKGDGCNLRISSVLNDTYKTSIWCSCLEKQIRNQSENCYIPQEPENLRFANVIIFFILHF